MCPPFLILGGISLLSGISGRWVELEPFFKNDEPAMNQKPTLALQIEAWTREALVRWGDDWERVASYVSMRFSEADEADRAKLTTEAELTLAGSRSRSDEPAH
jgi:hypothetical protein